MARALTPSSSKFEGKGIKSVAARVRNLSEICPGLTVQTLSDAIVKEFLARFSDAQIRETVPARVLFVGTMPPSVPGMRTQMQLKRAYEALGGTFLMGDEVLSAETEGARVRSVETRNIGRIGAGNFLLATGSYFSKGIASDMNHVYEPLFGADVIQDEGRGSWYDPNFFNPQSFLSYGVATTPGFKVLKDGVPFENLYAAGSVLGGCRSLALGCGAGVALVTALSVAETI